MSSKSLSHRLRAYWDPSLERVGVVLSTGRIIELKNLSPTPGTDFYVKRSDLDRYPSAVATWHTHPANNKNLSYQDLLGFLSLPHLSHYVVTETNVRKFSVDNQTVMLDEASCL